MGYSYLDGGSLVGLRVYYLDYVRYVSDLLGIRVERVRYCLDYLLCCMFIQLGLGRGFVFGFMSIYVDLGYLRGRDLLHGDSFLRYVYRRDFRRVYSYYRGFYGERYYYLGLLSCRERCGLYERGVYRVNYFGLGVDRGLLKRGLRGRGVGRLGN